MDLTSLDTSQLDEKFLASFFGVISEVEKQRIFFEIQLRIHEEIKDNQYLHYVKENHEFEIQERL